MRCCDRVKTLSDPAHRFKVRKNAEQMNLTGACIFNPAFSVVYVEGAAKFIRQYKRLMLHRIAWTEPARERGNEDVELDEGDEGEGSADKGKARATAEDIVPDIISFFYVSLIDKPLRCWPGSN